MKKNFKLSLTMFGLGLTLATLACSGTGGGATPVPAGGPTKPAGGDQVESGGNGEYVVKKFEFAEEGLTIEATGHLDGEFYTIAGIITNNSGKVYDGLIWIELYADGKLLETETVTGERDGAVPAGGTLPTGMKNYFQYINETGQAADDFKLAVEVTEPMLGGCVYQVTDWEIESQTDTSMVIAGSTSPDCSCDSLLVVPEVRDGEYLWSAQEWPVDAADGRFELELMQDIGYPAGGEVKGVNGACLSIP